MKKIIALVLSLTCFCLSTAMAFGNLSIKYNSETREIEVIGDIEGLTKNEAVKVIILKPNTDTINEASVLGVNEKFTSKYKHFDFSEKLPDNAPGGEYKVIVQSKTGGVKISELIVMSDDFLISKMNEIDKASANGIISWLEENAYNFEFAKLEEFEIYSNLENDKKLFVCEALSKIDFHIDNVQKISEKVEALKNSFKLNTITAYANSIGKDDAAAMIDFMKKYEELIDADEYINECMSKFSSDKQSEVIKNTFSEDFNSILDINEKYTTNVILKAVEGTSHWSGVAEIFDKEKDFLNVDSKKEDLISSSEIYRTYTKLVGKVYSGKEKLLQAFYDAIDETSNEIAKQKESKKGGSSGGSGGSSKVGGNSAMVVFKPAATPEPTKEDIKADNMFTDLDDVPWAVNQINELAKQGAISGYGNGKYGPKDNVTRGQFIKILVSAFGLTIKNLEKIPFRDISESDVFSKEIKIAYSLGLINGLNETSFGTNEPISREDACVVIYRALSFIEIKMDGNASSFNDNDEISDYALPGVSKLTGIGIINGDNGNFKPKSNITRAEVAVVFNNAVNKFMEVKGK